MTASRFWFNAHECTATVRTRTNLALRAITLISALLTNMAVGFILGIGWHYARKRFTKLSLEKKG